MTDAVIEVRDLGIYFDIYHKKGSSKKIAIGSYGKNLLRKAFLPNSKRAESDLFWALKNISFEVKKGEFFGIIGENGSGKSTLLKSIVGILRPDKGTVNVQGNIGALLELGAGFHPELTGRENIYLNGSILGMKKREIDRVFEDIVTFSELEKFLDLPIKSYSSGMKVRLGFSIASFLEPEILIIDEALAVGDALFQLKCFTKINEFIKDGKTIILVSHNTEQIRRFSKRVLLLHEGNMIGIGNPSEMVNRYKETISTSKSVRREINGLERDDTKSSYRDKADMCPERPGYNDGEFRYGDQKAKIIDFEIHDSSGAVKASYYGGEKLLFTYHIKASYPIEKPIIGIALRTKDGQELYALNSIMKETQLEPLNKGDRLQVEFGIQLNLIGGDYFLTAGISEYRDNTIRPIDMRYDLVHINVATTKDIGTGIVNLDGSFILKRQEA